MRPATDSTLADQTAGSETRPGRNARISGLEHQTAEIRPAQARVSPAACTRCVQLSMLMLEIVLPYFLYIVVYVRQEEQLRLLSFQRIEWLGPRLSQSRFDMGSDRDQ
jgi:hypothetical protein